MRHRTDVGMIVRDDDSWETTLRSREAMYPYDHLVGTANGSTCLPSQESGGKREMLKAGPSKSNCGTRSRDVIFDETDETHHPVNRGQNCHGVRACGTVKLLPFL